MSSKLPATLPTLSSLNISPQTLNKSPIPPSQIASQWLSKFTPLITPNSNKDATAILNLFQPDAWWRDILALTWDIRTFHGHEEIGKLLVDRVLPGASASGWSNIELSPMFPPMLLQPFPDLAWIMFFITFNTSIGSGTGIIRLVPNNSTGSSSPDPEKIEWKAHAVLTSLTNLKDHPESLGHLRNPLPNHGQWIEQREKEIEYRDRDPSVIIIGAGQSGLDVAARLKALGVDTLVLEKNSEVGEQWKSRYQALCLHDPVWYDHMPYLPFPSTWPTYSPAPKLAGWLKSYAESMELNIWCSTVVHNVDYDEGKKEWSVRVTRGGAERVMKAKQVVFAMGLASGVPRMPTVQGSDIFKGKIHHSTEHTTAKEYIGKKVLIVGACTSAHDIAHDFYLHGVDVTMYQRGSTYIMSTKNGWDVTFAGTYEENGPGPDISDLLSASFPHRFAKLIQQRQMSIIKDLDRDILKGLEDVGFQLNDGIDGSGFPQLAWEKAGGYYLDVGASKLIAEKKIKLVSKTQLSHLTENNAVFEDGRTIPCDVVIYATGFGDGRAPIASLLGPTLGPKLLPLWGLNPEGEINSIWRGCGVDNMYVMMGNLALCRFHSLHVALQIKAREEGLWDGKRY